MKLYIAGGCSEHGRNCFLVKSKYVRFLVDCGRMKEKPQTPCPELTAKQIEKAEYLFLTHCHTDHAGALLWLYERGFRGRVCASAETFLRIPGQIRNALVLEELGGAGEEIPLSDRFSLVWGRSGHCIGSVWLHFRINKKKILFSGDYSEHSHVYRCDPIRDREADVAVLDAAYGTDPEDAEFHRKRLIACMDRLEKEKAAMLFPIPMDGRGNDLMQILSERGIPVYAQEPVRKAVGRFPEERFWLQDALTEQMNVRMLGSTEDLMAAVIRGEPLPEGPFGVLLVDSQLWDKTNCEFAERFHELGGKIVLTGKQDPSSFARRLRDEGRAEAQRITAHQTEAEMLALKERNRFRVTVPYHSRQELSGDDPSVRILKVKDTLKF